MHFLYSLVSVGVCVVLLSISLIFFCSKIHVTLILCKEKKTKIKKKLNDKIEKKKTKKTPNKQKKSKTTSGVGSKLKVGARLIKILAPSRFRRL